MLVLIAYKPSTSEAASMGAAMWVVALFAGLWAWSTWRGRRHATAMALRRPEIHERKDVFSDYWVFDFVEMLMVHEYNVYDWPSITSYSLYALRRVGDAQWEVQQTPESVKESMVELERDARGTGALRPERMAKHREALLRNEWRRLDDHMAARLDTHYKLFLARYRPIDTDSLVAYWERLVALLRDREHRQTERASARTLAS
ncbi:hypothetical protein [Corallococcus sp. AB038B]|uniref:hypothetical protein n=1 Tax=Corallococcus sp. AB038B TaxID=2316718 RepID=UPI0011C44EAD|nr:hypothetical protein [Corallococcus sp. AB038B]